jgi:hypothetical protein
MRPGVARLAVQHPVGVGNVLGVQDAVLVLQGVALGEIVADEVGVDGTITTTCATWMPRGPSSRAMLCASARSACLAPAKAAKLAPPRRPAVAPVNMMVPRGRRATMRLATSRPFRSR